MALNPKDEPPQSMYSASSSLLSWAQAEYNQRRSKQQSASVPTTATATRFQVRVQPGLSSTLPWLRRHPHHQKLYFRSREHQYEVAAVGFLHIATGSEYNEEEHLQLITILDPKHIRQRFYGGMRFDDSPKSQRDPEWAPYNGFTFVLPAVELIRDEYGQFFLAANFYTESSLEVLSEVLHSMVLFPAWVQNMDPAALMPLAKHVNDPEAFSAWDSSMTNILEHLTSGQYEKIVLARKKHFQFHCFATPTPVHILCALDEQSRRSVRRTSGETSTLDPSTGPCIQPCSDKQCSKSFAEVEHHHIEPNPGSYLFCLQLDNETAFLGCPPERLFHVENGVILTEALAGTVRRGIEGNEGQLLSELLGRKNLEEHRFVVDYIRDALQSCGIHVKENGPRVRRLPRLMHLATDIRGEIPLHSSLARQTEADRTDVVSTDRTYKLLRTMHPTPAVCGVPHDSALEQLRSLESFDRGFFAGPFGWISRDGGEFCVAIRSALIHGSSVTCFAGSGIVLGSESKSEWDETELKLSAFTDLLQGGMGVPPYEGNGFSLTNSDSLKLQSLKGICNSALDNANLDEARTGCKNQDLHDCSYSTMNSAERSMSGNSAPNGTDIAPKTTSEGHEKPPQTLDIPRFLSNSEEAFCTSRLQSAPNLNTLWGCCAIDELCRNGVRTFFVSPGSRSAPLAVGVTRSRHAELYIAHDERGAGFLAVGYSRATGCAAAVITSSGTAVANLLPAVVESSTDNLPLILLTADRPPELRDIGANQAIHQPDIFGKYTRWSKDVPCPSEEIPLKNLLSDIDYAVFMAGSGSGVGEEPAARQSLVGGPVHLNMMFREKLAPDEQTWNRDYLRSIGERWKHSLSPMTRYTCVREACLRVESSCYSSQRFGRPPDNGLSNLFEDLMKKKAGVVIVGGGGGCVKMDDEVTAILEIARYLRWPVIPDVCSGLRFEVFQAAEVAHYADQIFNSRDAMNHLVPDAVLQFGERITSKRIAQMISNAAQSSTGGAEFAHILVSASNNRCDPLFTVTHRVHCTIFEILASLPTKESERSISKERQNGACRKKDHHERSKLAVLSNLSGKVDMILQNIISIEEGLTEPQCARVICACLPRPSALFLGNSMPIRDFDAFVSPLAHNITLKVAANRGASGIDGVLSSGIGFGIGMKLDVTIVIGDMSMLHDLNALHLLRAGESSVPVRVTVVVINNGGGGIFSLLPIAKHKDVFSPVFDTPHSVKFRHACNMFGLEYCAVQSAEELREAIERRRTGKLHRLIEAVVCQDHSSNSALHQRLGAAVSQGLSSFFRDGL